MPTYKSEVVTQVLYIKADSMEEAEEKYNSHFDYSGGCPCGIGADSCDCVEEVEDVYHITTEEGEGN